MHVTQGDRAEGARALCRLGSRASEVPKGLPMTVDELHALGTTGAITLLLGPRPERAAAKASTSGTATLISRWPTTEKAEGRLESSFIIGAVAIGILAGGVAEHVMGRDRGLITDQMVGVVSAFLEGVIAHALSFGFASC